MEISVLEACAMREKSRNINAEEYRSRWGARASNWLESRLNQSSNYRPDGKNGDDKPIAYPVFGKPDQHGFSLRRSIALALSLLGCALALVAAVALHPATHCGEGITGPQAWPDLRVMQEQARASCAPAGERP
jgi:hypothetical protein